MSLFDDLMRLGLRWDPAMQAIQWTSRPPEEAWRRISREILTPGDPFELHRRLYTECYGDDALIHAIGPAWFPDTDVVDRSNITAVLRELNLPDYRALHGWSIEHRAEYW